MKLSKFIALIAFGFIYLLSSASIFPVYSAENKGRIFSWSNGSLPVVMTAMEGIIAVDTGELHNLALKADGTVWAWGDNSNGQLGDGTTQNSSVPVQVKGMDGIGYLENIVMIAAGERYSMALDNKGKVWMWGFNNSGYRGTGDTLNQNLLLPQKVREVSLFSNIVKIAAGGSHSLALNSDGTVFAWGINSQGVIGIGCSSGPFCPNTRFPRPILSNSIDIAAGNLHSIAVKEDGSVWGWGRYVDGQLGQITGPINQNVPNTITGLTNIKTVFAKEYSNAAITEDNKLFVWGGFYVYPLVGNNTPILVQELDDVVNVSVSHHNSFYSYGLAVKSDGTVWQWHKNDMTPNQISGLINIKSVSVSKLSSHLAVEKYDPLPTITPTPTPAPFLNLPVNNAALGKSFDEIALDPESWFDHKYPLQNVLCCTNLKVLNYTGKEITDYYRSHAGYDYASSQGLGQDKPVLAAAAGTASYYPKNGALGNLIKIDHKNGYQTWYAHLDSTSIDFTNNETLEVFAGQEIGKVGKTGNVTGPHLHFAVFKDENENGSFTDDYPFGLVDPLGWLGNYTDPWEEYELNGRRGAKSYNLFTQHTPPLSKSISTNGGLIDYKNLNITIPPNAADTAITIKITTGPFEKKSETIKSVAPSFFIKAYNTLNQNVNDFSEPVTLTYDYSDSDLSNINENSLKFNYYNEQTNEWEELPSILNTDTKTVVTITSHFSQFSVMGELKDTIAPTTSIVAAGEDGQENWYKTNVSVSLEGMDNDTGLGIFDTIYTIDGEEWDIYTNPLQFNEEGNHIISYMSYDKAGNEEEIKTYTFHIDKTLPEVSVNVNKSFLWPPNGKLTPITITGTSSDENLLKTWVTVQDEYGELPPILTSLGETVYLPASRRGNDKDGRKYTITAKGEDKAGNISTTTTEVIVSHDQGN